MAIERKGLKTQLAAVGVGFCFGLAVQSLFLRENGQSTEQPVQAADHPPTAVMRGEALYMQHCLACHQADGQGVPPMFPTLIDAPTLRSERLAVGVLLGGSTFLEQEGLQSDDAIQLMAGFAHLSDAELAALLAYLDARFGNTVTPTPAAIAQLRDAWLAAGRAAPLQP